jgi:hypothetical protein
MEKKQSQSTLENSRNLTPPSQLTSNQIAMIEEAIGVIGEFGEVRLVIERGRLHFITAQKSFNVRNYSPGSILSEYKQSTTAG